MKAALIQYRSITGDVEANIKRHCHWVEKAKPEGAKLVLFPELSLTGYEPTLASRLASTPRDPRLDIFQQLSNQHQMIIGIGLPLQSGRGTTISLMLFHPSQKAQVYHKTYLHPDELPFFVPGENESLLINNTAVGLGICYEITIAEHLQRLLAAQPALYLASVAKFENGITPAHRQLHHIAKSRQLPTAMVNAVGQADGGTCAGKSAHWNARGEMTESLTAHQEGILFLKV